MVDIGGIGETIGGIATDVKNIITENPIATAAIGAGIVGAGVIVGIAVAKKSSKKSKKRKKTSKKKTSRKGRKLKFGSKAYRKKYLGKRRKQRKPHTAGKRRDTSHRRIRFTKNNQPYIILPNGKARFVKRSSASRSRKLKGGRY
jgi:hypothetical protein